ncbi:MAG: hypothetical protein ACK6AD_10275 [Cyanobacteriota bacterium]
MFIPQDPTATIQSGDIQNPFVNYVLPASFLIDESSAYSSSLPAGDLPPVEEAVVTWEVMDDSVASQNAEPASGESFGGLDPLISGNTSSTSAVESGLGDVWVEPQDSLLATTLAVGEEAGDILTGCWLSPWEPAPETAELATLTTRAIGEEGGAVFNPDAYGWDGDGETPVEDFAPWLNEWTDESEGAVDAGADLSGLQDKSWLPSEPAPAETQTLLPEGPPSEPVVAMTGEILSNDEPSGSDVFTDYSYYDSVNTAYACVVNLASFSVVEAMTISFEATSDASLESESGFLAEAIPVTESGFTDPFVSDPITTGLETGAQSWDDTTTSINLDLTSEIDPVFAFEQSFPEQEEAFTSQEDSTAFSEESAVIFEADPQQVTPFSADSGVIIDDPIWMSDGQSWLDQGDLFPLNAPAAIDFADSGETGFIDAYAFDDVQPEQYAEQNSYVDDAYASTCDFGVKPIVIACYDQSVLPEFSTLSSNAVELASSWIDQAATSESGLVETTAEVSQTSDDLSEAQTASSFLDSGVVPLDSAGFPMDTSVADEGSSVIPRVAIFKQPLQEDSGTTSVIDLDPLLTSSNSGFSDEVETVDDPESLNKQTDDQTSDTTETDGTQLWGRGVDSYGEIMPWYRTFVTSEQAAAPLESSAASSLDSLPEIDALLETNSSVDSVEAMVDQGQPIYFSMECLAPAPLVVLPVMMDEPLSPEGLPADVIQPVAVSVEVSTSTPQSEPLRILEDPVAVSSPGEMETISGVDPLPTSTSQESPSTAFDVDGLTGISESTTAVEPDGPDLPFTTPMAQPLNAVAMLLLESGGIAPNSQDNFNLPLLTPAR